MVAAAPKTAPKNADEIEKDKLIDDFKIRAGQMLTDSEKLKSQFTFENGENGL